MRPYDCRVTVNSALDSKTGLNAEWYVHRANSVETRPQLRLNPAAAP
jgi:hypothetical protein